MSFDGGGNFTRNQDWTADRDAGPPNNAIDATKMDDEFDNYKGGLEAVLTRSGENSPTANLPMNAKKHTNTAIAAALTDYARASQAQDGSLVAVISVGGTADVVTGTSALSMTVLATNQVFFLIVDATNTTNVTLNINSIGATAVEKSGVALVAGDWTAGDGVALQYDGTAFQMLSPARTPVLTALSILAASLAANSVETAKIVDNAVTLAKQAGGTSDRLQGFDGSGDPSEITVAQNLTLSGGALTGPPTATTSAEGVVELATQAEVEAETAAKIVTADLVKNSPGVAKAWVHFDQTGSQAIVKSYNITSITDTGVGDTRITIATDFSDADYLVICGQQRTLTATTFTIMCNVAQTVANLAGVAEVRHYGGSGSIDIDNFFVSFFGD